MARKMKDSGIEWIGQIPEDWDIIKNKYILLSMYSGGTPSASSAEFYDSDGVPFVSISDMSNCAYIYDTKKHITELGIKDKKLKIQKSGTILYSIYATIGAVSELAIDATISQAILALQLKDTMNKQYYKYNLLGMRDWIFSTANGNTQFNLNAEKVMNFVFVHPTKEVQKKIADFLDNKVDEIDSIILKTKESIDEYKKYKRTVITEAVTKGLDESAEIKETQHEHIGLVPQHWEVKKIKYILSESGERTKTGKEEPLSMSQKWGLIPTGDMDVIPNMASSFDNCKIVHVNDLVFNKLKAHLGVFAKSEYEGLVSPDYAVYQAKNNDNMLFLEYVFKTPQYISQFIKYSRGVAQRLTRLYTEELFNIYIAMPPKEEQDRITEVVQERCKEIDVLIAKKEAFVEEMEAYKKSLIYEYVTGKKAVL